jgi:hypothetical protein
LIGQYFTISADLAAVHLDKYHRIQGIASYYVGFLIFLSNVRLQDYISCLLRLLLLLHQPRLLPMLLLLQEHQRMDVLILSSNPSQRG